MSNKGQRTHTRIIKVASELFYHQGYHATSYADIATKTGLGKGNIHYHFKSKDTLLSAVITQRIEGIRDQLHQWSLDCGTPYDCLERFISMFENNAKNLSTYGCPMGTLNNELGKSDPVEQAVARGMFDLFLRWLEARFRTLMPTEQAQAYAEHLMVSAQGIGVMAHAYRDTGLVERQAQVLRRWLASVC